MSVVSACEEQGNNARSCICQCTLTGMHARFHMETNFLEAGTLLLWFSAERVLEGLPAFACEFGWKRLCIVLAVINVRMIPLFEWNLGWRQF